MVSSQKLEKNSRPFSSMILEVILHDITTLNLLSCREIFIRPDRIWTFTIPGNEFQITGADSWNGLKFYPTETAGTLQAAQTLNDVAFAYIMERKDNIKLTDVNGTIVCTW